MGIHLPVTESFSTPLAKCGFTAIAECVRAGTARPRTAPVHDERVAGLERIVGIGVPR